MRLAAFLCALCLALIASAQAQSNSGIEISHPWARATAGTASPGVVYLKIVNHGAGDDSLTAASTPAAAKVELHATRNDNGVMKMRPLAEVPIQAGGSAEFKPGGMHIMLLGLRQPLKAGDSFPLTLTFNKAGAVETTVTIEKAGSMEMGDMPGMKM
ncbi:MAG TPA: copper chaperone PCu(A)C [Stellaceae bacterium]|nr:copper chaperone PCu(A)C [Stellaceae bacterium]